jgi:3-hydroxybutyryl-CoA dehydrogenase
MEAPGRRRRRVYTADVTDFQLNTGSAGPFRMRIRWLDVVLDIEEHYCTEHPEYPEGPRRLLRSYLKQGRLGVKSGAGFYDDYPHQAEQPIGA